MSKIQVNEIVNHFDTGAPDCPKGLTVTGFTTYTGGASFSGDVSIGGTLTYEDATNIDSVGVITARNGIEVTSGNIEVTSGNVHIAGVGATIGVATAYISSINDLGYPSAGPLSNRNLIDNGAMQVRQRTADIAVSQGYDVTTQGPIDRFRLRNHGDQWAGTLSRGTESVNNEFQHYWRLTTTTPETTVDGTNQLILEQLFEGYDVAHLNYGNSPAKSLTLSFWVRSSEAGTFIVKLYALDGNRLINKVYTIDSANTWEQKTVVFDGDTAGTIGNDESEGLRLAWQIAAGSDYTSGSTPSTWTAYSNSIWAAGHVQNGVMSTTSATFDITGVQLEVGTRATPFEHRSYGNELLRCQRYYQIILDNDGTNPDVIGVFAGRSVSTTSIVFTVPLAVPMRNEPVMTGSTVGTIYAYGGSSRVDNGGTGTLTLNSANEWSPYTSHVLLIANGFTVTDDRIYNVGGVGDGAYWFLSAEL
jgi:hypothetical protein